jgi:putative transposase
MTTTPRTPSYAGYRFPAEVISYAVYLYFRFPLSLRMVEEMLAVRGIEVSHETVRKWGLGPKGNAEGVYFGREIANGIRRRRPRGGDKWHLDEMVITAGRKLYLWRAVDQDGLPPEGRCQGPCSRPWSRADATGRRPGACCASS